MPEDDTVFDQELKLYLMWLDSKAILHLVDVAFEYSNAVFLGCQRVEDVWDDFVTCWATVFTGHAAPICLDKRSQLTSSR